MFFRNTLSGAAALGIYAACAAAPAHAVQVYDPNEVADFPPTTVSADAVIADIACDTLDSSVRDCSGLVGLQDPVSPYAPVQSSGSVREGLATGFHMPNSGDGTEIRFLSTLLGYGSDEPLSGLSGFDWSATLDFEAEALSVPDGKYIEGEEDDIAQGDLLSSGWYGFKFGGGPDFDGDTNRNDAIDTAFVYLFGPGSYDFDRMSVGGLSHVTYFGGACTSNCGGSSLQGEIPLPGALPLMGAGLVGLGFLARRRTRA